MTAARSTQVSLLSKGNLHSVLVDDKEIVVVAKQKRFHMSMKHELMLSGTTFLLPGMLTWAETKSRELSYLFQWLPFIVFKL